MWLHFKTAPRSTPVLFAHSLIESPSRSLSLTAVQSSMEYLDIAPHPSNVCNDR